VPTDDNYADPNEGQAGTTAVGGRWRPRAVLLFVDGASQSPRDEALSFPFPRLPGARGR
jgi:hypothetical protein